MRIAFVTSGLEPGRDGVGDYTTLLAGECERLGHETTRLALNDQHLESAVQGPRLLRLPSKARWPERANEARRWIMDFAPDFISLQFVCYGFHPRGLVGAVAKHLDRILGGIPIHMFFHELWIGDEIGAPLKDRIFGWLQRRGALAILRRLDVRLVDTSNEAYVHLLNQRRIKARRLPLFGSLPLPLLARPHSGHPEQALTFALFGTLHPVWPSEPLFSHLRTLGRQITIAHAGHIGTGAGLWEDLVRKYGGCFTFRRNGDLSPAGAAAFLNDADFGIATTPWSLIGKSAGVAAMLDSGLPVVVNRDDVQYPGFHPVPFDPLLLRMDAGLPTKLLAIRRRPPRLQISAVAALFIANWEAAAK